MASTAERLHHWNSRYERIPENQRFWVMVWALIAIGAVNMWLTVTIHFPFALLLVLAVVAAAAIRLPKTLGWLDAAGEGEGPARLEIRSDTLVHLNQRYEALPEDRRGYAILTILVVAGALNMWWSAAFGFPFGLLFLLVVLALIAIRYPWTAGWVRPEAETEAASAQLEMAHPAPLLGREAGPLPRPEEAPRG